MNELSSVENMKRYLYGELKEEEEAAFEDEFFADDELFDDLKTLENDLVDRFAKDLLPPEESRRFEAGLSKFPARREKLANAVALQSYIGAVKTAENPGAATSEPEREEKQSWRQSFFNLFSFPVFQYVTAAAALVLLATGFWLYYRNSALQPELAQGNNNQKEIQQRGQPDLRQKESPPQNQPEEKQQPEQASPQPSPTAKTEETRRPPDELNKTQENRKKPADSSTQPDASTRKENAGSTTLAVMLLPLKLTRSEKNTEQIKQIRTTRNTKTVNLTLELPIYAVAESYNVRLAETTIGNCLKARVVKNRAKYLKISLPVAGLNKENTFVVTECGDKGAFKAEYNLNVVR